MPEEIEFKLALSPSSLLSLSKHAAFEQLKTSPSVRKSLISTYFDTPDHSLRSAGISLRIRRDGSQFIQTIKGKRDSDALLMARDEWEFPVDKQDELDFKVAQGTVLAPFVATAGRQATIQPLFTVLVDREVVLLKYSASEIEIALDNGCVCANGIEYHFAEAELELKSGESTDLYALACEIAAIATVRPSTQTKADRGYELITAFAQKITKAAPLSLDSDTSTAEAFRIIARSCMKHFLANEELLRQVRLPEAVHQARVGLRRLRAAISVFRPVVDDGQRALISAELRWIASSLGDARDLDVYISNVLEPARNQHDSDEAFEELLETYLDQRKSAYDIALQALQSDRCTRAIMNAIAWFESGPWTITTDDKLKKRQERSINEFADKQLNRRHCKIIKHGENLEALEPEERHKVRIELKKLRYASEFFAGIYHADATNKHFRNAVSAMSKLQDLLGELNDIAMSRDRDSLNDAEEILRDEHGQHEAELMKKAKRTYKEFAKIPPFWEV